ncbi:hypothetical protein [Marinifilum sp. D737]|uniref:hypothetical protein n=1 Tax=Marinifilum sp. D737 TaxID=2969628 RepID=UPI0022735C58|nr:hypothetical protein [Marinifilum sp. D737]MCY1635325.1 hypothetical protein [Marinifilum sp. D737]
MKTPRIILILTLILWILSTGIIILDKTTPLVITSIKIYYSLLITSFALLAIIILRFWLKIKGETLVMSFSMSVALLFAIAYVFTWRLEWKTETILYKNLHLRNRTIEFQKMDLGAFGTKSRTIDRTKIFPYFEWNKEIRVNEIDPLTWKKADIDQT